MKIKIDEVLSDGHVFGKAKIFKFSKKKNILKDTTEEFEKFNKARNLALETLYKMKEKEPSFDEYLIAHEFMIKDPMLEKRVFYLINSESFCAEDAVKKAMNEIMANLLSSNSSYLKERASDILDVTNLIINSMNPKKEYKGKNKYIAIVDELLPSFLVNNHENLLGVIAKKGGFTSHSSIIARIWDIPFVLSKATIKNNDSIIIDTRRDFITINPDEKEIEKALKEIKQVENFDKIAVKHYGFNFLANVATNRDIKKAIDYNFDGIGLFRTELIFLNTDRPYTLLEHYEMYSSAVKAAKGQNVVFRTFDAKEDKIIPYLKIGRNTVDTYNKNKDIFENQIKALLAANKTNKVKIMFPMIESKDEFDYLKNWVLKIANENNFNIPKIGMMLETKKALKYINTFEDVDFISIGTNDLTKELYNIDRNNDTEYNSYIDDLIKELKKVVRFTEEKNIFLSVCGELAGIKEAALKFYELGIRNLSVSPVSIKALNSAYSEFIDQKRKLYIVGDSTLSSFNDTAYLYPRYGYGQFFEKYLDERIEVINLALSGRSAKSYLKEENYKYLFDNLRPNDFLFVAFGHNDQKDDDPYRFASAIKPIEDESSFSYYLTNYYIKKAKQIGAIIILASPISRLSKEEKYRGAIIHNTKNGNYKDGLLYTAKVNNVIGVDMTTLTKNVYQKITYKNAIYHHAIINAKDEKLNPEISTVDNTHLNKYGADYTAYLLFQALLKTTSELKNYILKDIKEPQISELEINPLYKFNKYNAPKLKTYKPKNLYADNNYFGTYFGSLNKNDDPNDFIVKKENDDFIVGTYKKMGKVSAFSTTIAYLFTQIPLNKNAKACATIKILNVQKVKQAAFGLMIRDDCYIDQKESTKQINSNFISAGMITTENTSKIFYYEKDSDLIIEKNEINKIYEHGEIIKAEILRLGQRITLKLIYDNKTYEKHYFDYDLKIIDNKYYYLGLFATNGTVISSNDFKIEILNDAIEA